MASWNIHSVVDGLQKARHDWRESQHRTKEMGDRELPSKEVLRVVVNDLCGILFPMRLGPAELRQETENYYIAYTLDRVLNELFIQVRMALHYEAKLHPSTVDADIDTYAKTIVQDFANALPDIRRLLDEDVLAAFEGDPAAHSVDEVLICYPGLLAIIYHRLSHQLYKHVPLVSRIISELAHSATKLVKVSLSIMELAL